MKSTKPRPDALDTPRLNLRIAREGDGRALYEAVAESIVHLRQFSAYLPWTRMNPSPEMSEEYCIGARQRFLEGTSFDFIAALKDSGRVIGCCGLHRTNAADGLFEIGYWCRAGDVKNGYITEAAREVVRFAFDTAGVSRLQIITTPANAASCQVAERLGFRVIQLLQGERTDGSGRSFDTVVYQA